MGSGDSVHAPFQRARQKLHDKIGRLSPRADDQCITYLENRFSDRVPLEAPVVALRLLEHLPEGALPLARLLVLLLDPQSHLHHAPRDVPVAPQRLHRLVVIAWTRCFVEQWSPRVLVLADELDLLEGILRLPLLHLLPDLADRGLRG